MGMTPRAKLCLRKREIATRTLELHLLPGINAHQLCSSRSQDSSLITAYLGGCDFLLMLSEPWTFPSLFPWSTFSCHVQRHTFLSALSTLQSKHCKSCSPALYCFICYYFHFAVDLTFLRRLKTTSFTFPANPVLLIWNLGPPTC